MKKRHVPIEERVDFYDRDYERFREYFTDRQMEKLGRTAMERLIRTHENRSNIKNQIIKQHGVQGNLFA